MTILMQNQSNFPPYILEMTTDQLMEDKSADAVSCPNVQNQVMYSFV